MASYVYNPSKAVTDLLSQYIEFDPEQLQLGIWSGHLSLQNVHLREEAIYPILNHRSRKSTHGQEDYQPVRYKLLSGTIGGLDIKIPWKRLVWGQGDVQVDLRNVVLVLALETHEETRERYQKQKNKNRSSGEETKTDTAEPSYGIPTFLDEWEQQDATEEEEETPQFRALRDKKQKRLREAERRLLQGRTLGPWLNSVKKKDDKERQEILEEETTSLKKESVFQKWLRGTTNSFVWRFLAGLQLNLENLKIVLVQDGVELGLVVPSVLGIAGKGDGESRQQKTPSLENEISLAASPPQNVVYEGAYEDGEHIDKDIKVTHIGVYLRKQVASFEKTELLQVPPEASTNEFVLRPLDVNFSFSLFYPYPPEKRKKLDVRKRASTDGDSALVPAGDGTASTASKRRRDKRERSTIAEEPETATETMTEDHSMLRSSFLTDQQKRASGTSGVHARMNLMVTPDKGHARRSSLYGPMRSTSVPKPAHRRNVTMNVPLALPENFETALTKPTRDRELSARFDGKLGIGAVQVVCSTRQYELMRDFLAGAARLRNGRPARSIHSVLDQSRVRRSVTVIAPARMDQSERMKSSLDVVLADHVMPGTREVRLELQTGGTERSEVILCWWRYAFEAVIWELRKRRRLRKAFQQRFLSFNWERQKYQRKEYVSLFIKCYLHKENGSIRASKTEEDRLMAIEDELPIEQILLYRSIARSLHVLGKHEMPESVLELQTNQNRERFEKEPRPETGKSPLPNRVDSRLGDDQRDFLSKLDAQCEVARQRRDSSDTQNLPRYEPFLSWTKMRCRGLPTEIDETTFATAVTREQRTKTNRISQDTMLLSFTVKVEEVELMIVEEELFSDDYPRSSVEGKESSFSMSGNLSDVSVLTDDKRFFRDDKGDPVQMESEEGLGEDAVPSSTDFLLFRLPERVLLRTTLSPLELCATGRTGEFRKVDFSIGRVKVCGLTGRDLLAIGEDAVLDAPVSEVVFPPSSSSVISQRQSPSRALSISLVSERQGTTMQCDAATVRLFLDLQTLEKTITFLTQSSVYFPSSLLGTTPQEEIRLYVLRENTQPVFFALNAAIRVYGFELVLPSRYELPDAEISLSQRSSGSQDGSVCVLRSELIEVYGGNSVDKLGFGSSEQLVLNGPPKPKPLGREHRTQTRGLLMLDDDDLASVASYLSRRWVVASSGIDIVTGASETASQLSLLQIPVNVEVLLAFNMETVVDYNRAKIEALVKISPLELVLSEARLLSLSNSLLGLKQVPPPSQQTASLSEEGSLPPRLEVLSRYAILSLEVSLSCFRMCFLGQDNRFQQSSRFTKEVQMRQSIEDFLSVVSKFDLTFPHEEALSSGMQICVDRLSGLGLSSEEAWQVANTALLNLLEDVAAAKEVAGGSHPLRDFPENAASRARQSSVERTMVQYAGLLEDDSFQSHMEGSDIVLDLPDGLTLATTQLFYDRHIHVSVPTLFLANGEGMHLLRLTPVDGWLDEGASSQETNLSDNSESEVTAATTNDGSDSQSGILLNIFSLDKNSPFGRGGLPLSVLGSDAVLSEGPDARHKEQLSDVEIGEVEAFVCRRIAKETVSLLLQTLSPLLRLKPSTEQSRNGAEKAIQADSHLLGVFGLSSVLFASDSLVPFTRAVLATAVTKTGVRAESSHEQNEEMSLSLHADSLEVLNLSPESELYSSVLSVLPTTTRLASLKSSPPPSPVYARYRSTGRGGEIELVLNSMRVVLLRRFLNELLQYFVSETYGFGDLLNTGASEETGHSSYFKYKISLIESSLVLPRSSVSSDMVALEVEALTIENSRPHSTFAMPTNSWDLNTGEHEPREDSTVDNNGDFMDCQSSVTGITKDTATGDKSGISRLSVGLQGFRLFTSLSETGDSEPGLENPSFNFFYSLGGRASADEPVYTVRKVVDTTGAPEQFSEENEERARRLWREITKNSVSIDVIVDFVTYTRILVSSPRNGSLGELSLETRLSQFCLVLSLWYSNMKELPLMFPYSSEELQAGAVVKSDRYDFPDFGTETMRLLLLNPLAFTSEFCIVLDKISLRFTFDCLDDDGVLIGETPGVNFCFHNPVVRASNDERGVFRIGAGASGASLVDESLVFQNILDIQSLEDCRPWADFNFGLGGNIRAQPPQPFQLSIFMVPSWTIYNVGMNSPEITLTDFSPVSRFIEFVSAYFSDEKYGNPVFAACNTVENIKISLRNDKDSSGAVAVSPEKSCTGTDFRLWITSPSLVVPCDAVNASGPCLRILGGSLWYRYTSFDEVSLQECAADGLCLYFCDHYQSLTNRKSSQGRTLIESLSFGFRMDNYVSSCHTDYSVSIPFNSAKSCGFASDRISVPPSVVVPPTVCTPFDQPNRYLGPKVCEVTCAIDILPIVSSAILALFSGRADSSEGIVPNKTGVADGTSDQSTEHQSRSTFSFVAAVGDLRFFALDPVLGPHLPVAVVSIASVRITASQFAPLPTDVENTTGSCTPEDFQVVADAHLWADYFKLGMTRSWEPLMEAYSFSMLWEKARLRGSGVSLSSDSPLHFNISGALLVLVNEVVDIYSRLIRDTFGSGTSPDLSAVADEPTIIPGSSSVLDSIGGVPLLHQQPAAIETGERVAFSLKNLSGQKFRVFRSDASSQSAVTTYLGHGQVVKLSFQPSISMIQNMAIREVDFPGFSYPAYEVAPHVVDLQLPGYHWLRGLKVDTFGRSFSSISPRSNSLSQKIDQDWRLANLMKILVEIGLENGGRQVTVRSLFTVVNKTSHDVSILCHPSPSFTPADVDQHRDRESLNAEPASEMHTENEDACIKPGCAYDVPILLLQDALESTGSHLGFLWLKPSKVETMDLMQSFLDNVPGSASRDLQINYSSRSVKLERIVNDSAILFERARGHDVSPDAAKTGVQVSCPVIQSSGDRLAPFCYAVEVGRSPLIESGTHTGTQGDKKQKHLHGPVSYTLSIHAPFVIINLLPKKGRFELMHAVRKTVLWFADLDAGEQVSVHSVGLDAPLLLLINLGFCRTPIGEGALVHHGVDPPPGARDALGGLKSIGKAGKAVTRQLGKTLTSIGESPEKRAQQKVDTALFRTEKSRPQQAANQRMEDSFIKTGTGQVDGKTYRIDTSIFFPHDVSDETTLIDSIGQRLNLNIENIRGGGGQRRVSVFCPFWVVNTTEHALRYKQEGSKVFVSGTVVSPDKNGSVFWTQGSQGAERTLDAVPRPLEHSKQIFSGTPGALASNAGRCELPAEEVAQLVDVSLSLEQLAQLAFMFNFHEGLSVGMSSRRMCIQLGDGRGESPYHSEWSRGFSLDSVAISQMVSMHCKDGRFLELTVFVYVAPGALTNYTKIVRILPRYIVVNTLPYPVRLWQDSSIYRPVSSEHHSTAAGDKKWRYRKETGKKGRVNKYEALWGREVILDDGFSGSISNDTTANQSALYISTVDSCQLLPFSLPDSRDERQLRIGLGGSWKLTASFAADVAGDHVLALTRGVDLRLLPHVSTRASPEYLVRLQPGIAGFEDDLGVWFETEWGSSRSVIVKAVKKNSYAFNQTDIHVGDELLKIDSIPVSRNTFSEVMAMLRTRLGEISVSRQEPRRTLRRPSARLLYRPENASRRIQDSLLNNSRPLTLTFRTVEERLRRVRLKAARATASTASNQASESIVMASNHGAHEALEDSSNEVAARYIRAELKTLHHMMFLVVREDESPPFEIRNCTFSCVVYFRQKGCDAHSWCDLKPGETSPYTWQEPLKLKRLSIRVAPLSVPESETVEDTGSEHGAKGKQRAVSRVSKFVSSRKVRSEEDAFFSATTNVRLEEIGFRDVLLYRSPEQEVTTPAHELELEVGVAGLTRILVIKDIPKDSDRSQSNQYFESLKKSIDQEEIRVGELTGLRDSSGDQSGRTLLDVENTAERLMDNFPGGPRISARHQILVEVLEAFSLTTHAFVGDCNPYAEIRLKSGETRPRSLLKRKDVRRTYYVKKSVNPTWESQSFVFDVPPAAVDVPRGHAVSVRLRSLRPFGRRDYVLGTCQVDLHTLRSQEPLVGLFPLAGRTGRRELNDQLSHWGRGSVRLRLQWIFSEPALLQYFILLAEKRLGELRTRVERLEEQVKVQEAVERKEKHERDGLKAVRIQDLLSFSKDKLRIGTRHREGTQVRSSIVKLKRPPQIVAKAALSVTSREVPRLNITSVVRAKRLVGKHRSRQRARTADLDFRSNKLSAGTSQYLENQIMRQRQYTQELLSRRHLEEKETAASHLTGCSKEFPVSSLKTWTLVQMLLSDAELETFFEGDNVRTLLRPLPPRLSRTLRRYQSEDETLIAKKFELPARAPSPFREFSQQQIVRFAESRAAFEHAARRSLSAILHPGGWLTIRPIRALNLSDSYAGMLVKLRYGSETLVTGSVDGRVSPKWSAMGGATNVGSDGSEEPNPSNGSLDLPNDLHIHVSPQRTNGLLRLSVVGERSQQQLQGRTELGILYIPLGAAIAACIDGEPTDANKALQYQRWFPLLSPQEAVPSDGDEGLSIRPPDSEKHDERSFKDYYMPCIELALIWRSDEGSDSEAETERASAVPSLQTSSSVKNYINADLARISAALIDSERASELLSFNILDLDARYWVTNVKTRVGVSMRWFQLDNQQEDAREPIILAPTPKDFMFPVLQFYAMKDNERSTDVDSFDFIDVSIAEFDMTIEENFLFDLFDFINSVLLRQGIIRMTRTEQMEREAKRNSPVQSLMKGETVSDEPSLLALFAEGFTDGHGKSKNVYVEQLFLGVVKFNLSYLKGKRNPRESTSHGGRSDRRIDPSRFIRHVARVGGELQVSFSLHHRKSDVYDSWSRQTSDEDRLAEDSDNTLQNLPKMFTTLFPNLSDAPVRIQGKALNHVFESPTEILHSVRRFYVNETLKQIYKIIGSLDFVGNPTMLVTSVVSGVKDLVAAPSAAFMKSPKDPSGVGIGVAKGTLSFVSHSFSGFFGFCARVSASAGQTIATLSLDEDFSDWHRDSIVIEAKNLNRQWKRRGMQSVRLMIGRPIGDLFFGIVGGLFGVVLSPVKGYRRHGSSGLAPGLAIGLIGVVARPVVGVLDAFAHFTASIHDIAKSVNVLERRVQPATRMRLPYSFGIMGVLMPFGDSMARADFLLRQYPLKKSQKASLDMPEMIIHVEVLPDNGTDTYAIATSARVILIRVKKELSGHLASSLCWEVFFSPDTLVSSKVADHGHSGVALTIALVKQEAEKESVDNPSAARVVAKEILMRATPGLNFSQRSLDVTGLSDLDSSIVEANKESDQSAGREGQGEPVELFTVLAEYQYRRQLGRLHNAISCIVGDFDAILRDPSLSPRSYDTEGYLSFGIYYFAAEDDDGAQLQRAQSVFFLPVENLPWAWDYMFRQARMQSPEQNSSMLQMQRQWGFSDYLEASKEEGGPDWMIEARAMAVYLDTVDKNDTTEDVLANSDVLAHRTSLSQDEIATPLNAPEVRFEGSSRIVSDDRLVTPKFGESVSRASGMLLSPQWTTSLVSGEQRVNSNGVFGEGRGRLQRMEDQLKSTRESIYLSARESYGTRNSFATARGSLVGLDDLVAPHLPEVGESVVRASDSEKLPSPQLTTMLESGEQSVNNSGETAQGRGGLKRTEGRLKRTRDPEFDSIRGSDDAMQSFATAQDTLADGGGFLTPRSDGSDWMTSGSSVMGGLAQEEEEEVLPSEHRGKSPERLSGLRETPEKTKPTKEVSGLSPENRIDRMDRMEALMERMLVFSSEQALLREQQAAPSPTQNGEEELVSLRQEIAELRTELQRRTTSDSNAAEIAALRQEISSLRTSFRRARQFPPQPQQPSEETDVTEVAEEVKNGVSDRIEDID